MLRNRRMPHARGNDDHTHSKKRGKHQANGTILSKASQTTQPFRARHQHYATQRRTDNQPRRGWRIRPQRRHRNARKHRVCHRVTHHRLSTQHQYRSRQRTGHCNNSRQQGNRNGKTHARAPPLTPLRRGAATRDTPTKAVRTRTITGPVGTLPTATEM